MTLYFVGTADTMRCRSPLARSETGALRQASMKPSSILIVTSLLSIVLFTFHLADDIVRGFEPGGFKNGLTVATSPHSRRNPRKEGRLSTHGPVLARAEDEVRLPASGTFVIVSKLATSRRSHEISLRSHATLTSA